MGKQIITKELLHNRTLAGGLFALIFINIFGLIVGGALSIAFHSPIIILLAVLGLIVASFLMLRKQKEFKANLPEYIVFEDTATRAAKEIYGTRNHRGCEHYLWFEDLNRYHNYGWVRPSLYYAGLPKGKYYLIKKASTNEIVFTYEINQYELGEDLKMCLQSVESIIMRSGAKGKVLDESSSRVKIQDLV